MLVRIEYPWYQCKLDSTMNNYPAGDWKHPRTPEVVEVSSDQKLVSSWLNELLTSESIRGLFMSLGERIVRCLDTPLSSSSLVYSS